MWFLQLRFADFLFQVEVLVLRKFVCKNLNIFKISLIFSTNEKGRLGDSMLQHCTVARVYITLGKQPK